MLQTKSCGTENISFGPIANRSQILRPVRATVTALWSLWREQPMMTKQYFSTLWPYLNLRPSKRGFFRSSRQLLHRISSKITCLRTCGNRLWPSLIFPSTGNPHSVQKLLPVENLQDYCHFIMECPSIEQYITFQDSTLTRSGFDVYFKNDSIQSLQIPPTNNKKGDEMEISSFELLANQDPSKTDTDTHNIPRTIHWMLR